MENSNPRIVLGILLALVPLIGVYGHPHMFIDALVVPVLGKDSLLRIDITWTFDMGFTEMIRLDFDQNKNGNLEPPEVARIETGAFANLAYYNYFSKVFLDGREMPVTKVTSFHAGITGKQALFYRFSIPINQKIAQAGTKVELLQYDKSFFADMVIKSSIGPIKVPATSPIRGKAALAPAPNLTYYEGIVPKKLILELSWAAE